MSILINLLPGEEKVIEKEKARRSLVIKITAAVILLTILITTVAFAYKVYQGNQQEENTEQLATIKQQLGVLQEQEGYLNLVKKRLATIGNLQSQQSRELLALNLIYNLLPNSIVINSLNSSRDGVVLITGRAPDTSALEILINSLTDPDIIKQKISKISIDNLSRDAQGGLRFDISATTR